MAGSDGDSEPAYSVERILYAAQIGELDALASASAESWFLSRWFQRLLCIVHDTSQSPWRAHTIAVTAMHACHASCGSLAACGML